MIVSKVVESQHTLLQVVDALQAGGGNTDFLNSWEQQSDQDGHYRNDDQQFDEGKRVSGFCHRISLLPGTPRILPVDQQHQRSVGGSLHGAAGSAGATETHRTPARRPPTPAAAPTAGTTAPPPPPAPRGARPAPPRHP